GYEYPVRPGTAEWTSLENHQEMVDACQIPEDILESMSTEELVQTVVAYPLNADMFAYDSTDIGFEIVSEHFNGLKELQERSDSASELIALFTERPLVLSSALDSKTISELESGTTVTTTAGYDACNLLFN